MSSRRKLGDYVWFFKILDCLDPSHRAKRDDESLFLAIGEDRRSESENMSLGDIAVMSDGRDGRSRKYDVLLNEFIYELVGVEFGHLLGNRVVLEEPSKSLGKEN